MIGPPVTVNVSLVSPTLCTVPSDRFVELIVTFPFAPLTEMPVPAFNLVTPVLVTVIILRYLC